MRRFLSAGGVAGVVVTAHASVAHTVGPAVELLAAADNTFAAEGCRVTLCAPSAVGTYLVEIVQGPALDQVLVPGLLFQAAAARRGWLSVPLPLGPPMGARLGVRVQSSALGGQVVCGVELMAGKVSSEPLCRTVDAYGADAADSTGLQVDPGPVVGQDGAWTELTAALVRPARYAVLLVGDQANATPAAQRWAFDLGVGPPGAEAVIVPDVRVDALAPSTMAHGVQYPFAASTRLVVRARSTAAHPVDRLRDVTLLCCGG